MRKFIVIAALLTLSLLLLSACGGGGGEAVDETGFVGNPTRGENLYTQTTIGPASAPGCITCHSLEPDTVIVGPSHAGIGAEAETRVADMSAEEYLRQSIVEPNAEITEGYTADVMYQNYGEELSEQDIDDLVAFLLTQK